MGSRPFPLPPLLTLSTRASPVLRLRTFFRIAADAGVDGVDLDLSGRPLPRHPHGLTAAADAHGTRIASVWVPQPGPWTVWRKDQGTRVAAAIANATGAAKLVVDLPMADGRVTRSAVTGVTESLRAAMDAITRVTVVVRARHLDGGRGHLVQMTALRRLAEEWDFDVALDLLGLIDPLWEAEAAVARLGARLTLIRLGGAIACGPAVGRGRGAARALATALDNGHPITFALAPSVPLWRVGWAPALANASAGASQRILARFSTIEEQRVLAAFPRPRPGFRG